MDAVLRLKGSTNLDAIQILKKPGGTIKVGGRLHAPLADCLRCWPSCCCHKHNGRGCVWACRPPAEDAARLLVSQRQPSAAGRPAAPGSPPPAACACCTSLCIVLFSLAAEGGAISTATAAEQCLELALS